MRLTLHTDYALRVLIRVGRAKGQLVTVAEIAEDYQISRNHLTKVVHKLGLAGYLETVRGKNGGMRLGRRPEEIRLGHFVRDIEEDMAVVRCMRDDESAECLVGGECLARTAFAEAMDVFITTLDRYTLADVLARGA